jgi:hypothetical protein
MCSDDLEEQRYWESVQKYEPWRDADLEAMGMAGANEAPGI